MTEADRLSDERRGICECWDCDYYRSYVKDYFCCNFTANGGHRPMRPVDCYHHEGTPYKPRPKKDRRHNNGTNHV